ncbi:hypothetical protein BH11PSE12_BH11PSE12_17270 [soil metagenome]
MFYASPRLAWGFYGHRLNLYRQTVPHPGFAMLLEMAATMPYGARVFTSNVDGQFQKAGFAQEHITECHGSIHHLQCLNHCTDAIWPADDFTPVVDETACELVSDFPTCPHCGGMARPNILMFSDGAWIESRSSRQESRLHAWLARLHQPVLIELGAGTAFRLCDYLAVEWIAQ